MDRPSPGPAPLGRMGSRKRRESESDRCDFGLNSYLLLAAGLGELCLSSFNNILYDANFWKKLNYEDIKKISGCQRLVGGRSGRDE